MPSLETRIQTSFKQQQVMKLLEAKLLKVSPGEVHIELPFHSAITQQHGYVHAGIITTIIDSACGYAAFSLMPPGSDVLAVEFKINFMFPAKGEKFVGIGKVIKPGRTLTVCSGEMHAFIDDESKLVALMQATMMCVESK
jgi:uncharacterized protein (TIGR00369 family)